MNLSTYSTFPSVRKGFSLLELTVVLTIASLSLGFAAVAFNGYLYKMSAQRAAQVFAQDLRLARSAALRAREPVAIRFYEGSRWYTVVMQQSGTELTRRRFGVNADIDLTGVDLRMRGDTVLFTSRGVADLKNAFGSVGEARFQAGTVEYRVYFNAMGASKVEEW
ncbi:MAG: Tfp pilus assembly protein FimT/FimU [Gemmatimonadota bacterium]